MQENSQQNHIDLSGISRLLSRKKDFNKFQMQIFEEVVFLCINENFIKDVQKIRKYFIKKHPRIDLPAKHTFKAENVVRFLYLHHHKKYKQFIAELLKKYKLIPFLYWDDKIAHIEWEIEDEMRDQEHSFFKSKKSHIRFNVIEDKLEDYPLNLMDNIILRNSPFLEDDAYPFWNDPHLTRKTSDVIDLPMSIEYRYGAFLNIGFPAYASLSEMKEILKDNFKKIQEYRAEHLPVTIKKDYRKSELEKSVDAYMLFVGGEKIERIAVTLDKKYGGEHTFEGINKMIERMKKEAERFDKIPKQSQEQLTAFF